MTHKSMHGLLRDGTMGGLQRKEKGRSVWNQEGSWGQCQQKEVSWRRRIWSHELSEDAVGKYLTPPWPVSCADIFSPLWGPNMGSEKSSNFLQDTWVESGRAYLRSSYVSSSERPFWTFHMSHSVTFCPTLSYLGLLSLPHWNARPCPAPAYCQEGVGCSEDLSWDAMGAQSLVPDLLPSSHSPLLRGVTHSFSPLHCL
jgi:hypothetical protein